MNAITPFTLISVLLLTIVAGCSDQGASDATDSEWVRGNLHTHSFWSDGDDFPESILQWYRDAGYDFVAMSDHNTIAEGERWMTFPPGGARRETAERFVRTFGPDGIEVERSGDTLRVRLRTYDEYSNQIEVPDSFLVIRAEEISDRFESRPIHVNATNIQEYVAPAGGTSVVDVMQRNVDAVLNQRDSLNVPIMPHINHPNFGWAVRAEELAALEGERFFEVYNGHPLVNNNGDSLRMGMERMWDVVNTIRLEDGMPLMYGIAVDDAHHYQEQSMDRANTGRGWVVVNADMLSAAAIIRAMEAGRFYSSTGVALEDVSVRNGSLHVQVDPEAGVSYRIDFIGTEAGLDRSMETVRMEDGTILTTHFDQNIGRVLLSVDGPEASFEIPDDLLYVRALVTSSKVKKNPFAEGEVERAWTQPVRPD